ncbi:hypothetical protein GCM10025865_30600 [Paraoerskovia sediminicola]|uniref:Uncharacterized protein n=1 Tax=Paraoerskovia sediminicola TaxID=1138587 RepID=A0ABM8G6J9_9CELL|nr:hypothetical protein [Paraoerskovia sediminicola]BDZ43761.1 hypothetical protein GCM10025865_30600 [Paraoerskovia sediminicola]
MPDDLSEETRKVPRSVVVVLALVALWSFVSAGAAIVAAIGTSTDHEAVADVPLSTADVEQVFSGTDPLTVAPANGSTADLVVGGSRRR